MMAYTLDSKHQKIWAQIQAQAPVGDQVDLAPKGSDLIASHRLIAIMIHSQTLLIHNLLIFDLYYTSQGKTPASRKQ